MREDERVEITSEFEEFGLNFREFITVKRTGIWEIEVWRTVVILSIIKGFK